LDVNKRIGLQRAETVKKELVRQGISAERLATESRWYSEPLLPNTSNANRSKNRRVEFKEVK
jgi:outer membrane protein OmpA-like peptidoglycan-associated protein